MQSADLHHATRSLASITRGEVVEVGDILFDGVRALCETVGIRRGTRVRCRDASPTQIVLETEAGRLANLERRWAEFVEATDTLADRRNARLPA